MPQPLEITLLNYNQNIQTLRSPTNSSSNMIYTARNLDCFTLYNLIDFYVYLTFDLRDALCKRFQFNVIKKCRPYFYFLGKVSVQHDQLCKKTMIVNFRYMFQFTRF